MANQIPCVGLGKYQECLNILTDFVPNRYELSSLIGSKCKAEANACCVWSAFYVGANNATIPENETVQAANRISIEQPGCAKPLKIGKAWSGNTLGVIIRWKKTNCSCGSFFEYASTTLYLTELHIERQDIFTGPSSTNKLTSWKFGTNKYDFTFVHYAVTLDLTPNGLITTAMALQNVSRVQGNEILYVGIVQNLLMVVRVYGKVLDVDVRKEILSLMSSICPAKLYLIKIDIWSNDEDEDYDFEDVSDEIENVKSNVNLCDISQSTMASIEFIIKTFSKFQI